MILAALMACTLPVALSAETVIENTVQVRSSSGGNVANSGEVVSGTSKNSISIQTTINGEVVEDYSSEGDEPVSYEKSIRLDEGKVETKVRASASASARAEASGAEAIASDTNTSAISSTSVAASTSAAASASGTGVSFISDLLAKIFSYVTLWFSLR